MRSSDMPTAKTFAGKTPNTTKNQWTNTIALVLEVDPSFPGEWENVMEKGAEEFRRMLRSREMLSEIKKDKAYGLMSGTKLRASWLSCLVEMRVQRFKRSGYVRLMELFCGEDRKISVALVFDSDGTAFHTCSLVAPSRIPEVPGKGRRKERTEHVD